MLRKTSMFIALIFLCLSYLYSGVNFESGSAELLPSSMKTLDELGKNIKKELKKNPSMIIYVHGHTDDVGKYFKNKMLSWERAWSVKEYISEKFRVC